MKISTNTASVMGFARYEKRENVEVETLISTCLNWRRQFLDHQKGIIQHYFLGNLKGQFADAIFATDLEAYRNMTQRYPESEYSHSLMSLLEPSSVRLTPTVLLKENVNLPTDFSCIEFGTFHPKQGHNFSEESLLAVSQRIEREYLANHHESLEHFIGKVDSETYAEVTFARTLGAARNICNGYVEDALCGEMLAMFDPETVDLDFWYLLA